MRKLVLIAAMLMASASAQAGNSFSFNVEGHKVRVNIPRNCASLSCISVSAPTIIEKFKDKDEETTTSSPAPVSDPTATQAPAPVATAPQVAPSVTVPVAQQPASTKVTVLPAPSSDNATNSVATAAEPAPLAAPVPPPVQAPVQAQAPVQPQVVASAPATVATPAASAPEAIQAATSPIGLWMSEKKEGKIRIEDCNGNLCGYAVDAKTGANGAKVLINMKPRGDKWAGRINDTRSGGTYDSTIAMRGGDKLKVQGCAFGGMFCGGETWTRIQ